MGSRGRRNPRSGCARPVAITPELLGAIAVGAHPELRGAPAERLRRLLGGLLQGCGLLALEEATLEDTLVAVVNLAGETDTMAAVAGGACGAASGVEAIPARWLEVLHERERIERVGREFAALRHRLVYRKPSLPEFSVFEAGEGLMAGRNPLTGEDVAELLESGVTAVLDLREEKEWTKGAPRAARLRLRPGRVLTRLT